VPYYYRVVVEAMALRRALLIKTDAGAIDDAE
jgi:hypothetical protein